MTTETHAILYQSADGTLSLGMKCKTPECAALSIPFGEGDTVLGTVALIAEPVSGLRYRKDFLAAQPPKAEERLCDFFADVGEIERFMDELCNVVSELTGDEGEDDPITVLRRHIKERTATPTAAADSDPCVAKYLPTGSIIFGDQDYETTKPCFEVVHRGVRYYLHPASKASIARLNEQDAARNQEGGK